MNKHSGDRLVVCPIYACADMAGIRKEGWGDWGQYKLVKI